MKNESILFDRKGQSSAYLFIIGLFTLLAGGILYVIFSQVFSAHIIPLTYNMVNDSTLSDATKTDLIGKMNLMGNIWTVVPIIIILIVGIVMIKKSLEKSENV